MKKRISLFLIISLLLSLCFPAFADEAAQAGGAIPFRFATREEGMELLLANDEYRDW